MSDKYSREVFSPPNFIEEVIKVALMYSGWVGFDLDGTLAIHPTSSTNQLGEPVPAIVDIAQQMIDAGVDVRIMTARANDPDQFPIINSWCVLQFGRVLPITARKDYSMIALFDDRAFQVERDTGRIIQDTIK